MALDKWFSWNRQILQPQKMMLTKMAHIAKKDPDVIGQGLSRVVFKRKFLILLYDSHLAPSFLWDVIFVRWYFWKEECPFTKIKSMETIFLMWSFWPSTSIRCFRLCYLAISCSVICRTFLGRRLLEDYA